MKNNTSSIDPSLHRVVGFLSTYSYIIILFSSSSYYNYNLNNFPPIMQINLSVYKYKNIIMVVDFKCFNEHIMEVDCKCFNKEGKVKVRGAIVLASIYNCP